MHNRRQAPPRFAPTPAAKEHASLQVEFAELSDVGQVRTNNEDYIGHVAPDSAAKARSHGWLFVLADGVGGGAQGEVASRTAVETILSSYEGSSASEPVGSLLAGLVKAANTRVHEAGVTAGPSGAGMATTIVACAVRYDRAYVTHVGDSRCYLIRNRSIKCLTRDHTVANEQIRLGIGSGEDNRHVLSRAVGTEIFVTPAVTDVGVQAGDTLLLCSDGLHGAVSDPEIAKIIRANPDFNTAAKRLIGIANELDGGDNVSVQLIRIRDVERMGVYRGRPYKLK